MKTPVRNTMVAPAVLAVLLVGVASCAGGDDAETDDVGSTGTATVTPPSGDPSLPPPTAPTTAVPTPASSAAPFTADTRPDDGGRGSGNGLGVIDVRVARQSGFDRVVFDLEGSGTPGWRVEYVARPIAEGSGETVAIEGTAYLQVLLRGVGLPYDTGVPPFGDSETRVPGADTRGVAEVAPGGVFEGEQQAFLGLTGGERPFRVFSLTDPARVVVDVRHD